MMDETTPGGSAFEFTGTWREFAPIAFTNLLLTIVTLGIYRFWAKTRERRYLWSRTNFIDDPLEWTGTGKELLIGFLIAVPLFGIPLIALQILVQSLMIRGEVAFANLLSLCSTLLLLYVVGLARFRALRYRLSRTYWHGIRGGSDERGYVYGWSFLWRTMVGGAVFGLLLPWAMTENWNMRWNSMTFGPQNFTSGAEAGPVLRRLLLCYGIGIGGMILLAIVGSSISREMQPLFGIPALIVVFGTLAVLVISYYAAFMRQAIGNMTLNRIEFHFSARTWDVFKLLLGDLGLLIVTLGLGFVFIGYRHWSFLAYHLEASGEVTLSELTQSTTDSPKQGEGLLDAFDVGAF